MTAGAQKAPPETPERCPECGAPPGQRPPEAPATPQREMIPAGTHCEWCGAEFPDD